MNLYQTDATYISWFFSAIYKLCLAIAWIFPSVLYEFQKYKISSLKFLNPWLSHL